MSCSPCGGKIRWTSKGFNGNRIENVCSCGGGKEFCEKCDGFGDVEVVIRTQKEYKLFNTKNSQYTGEVPEKEIKKITGDLIYEQIYEYPLDMVREMLVGGIDANEFNQLNNKVLDHLKQSIDKQLKEPGDIDTSKIHNQLDILFSSLPNPEKENKFLNTKLYQSVSWLELKMRLSNKLIIIINKKIILFGYMVKKILYRCRKHHQVLIIK